MSQVDLEPVIEHERQLLKHSQDNEGSKKRTKIASGLKAAEKKLESMDPALVRFVTAHVEGRCLEAEQNSIFGNPFPSTVPD